MYKAKIAKLYIRFQKSQLVYSMRNVEHINRRLRYRNITNLILKLQHKELFGE